MPRLLELFAGTGSIGRAFRDLGWEVVSLDNCAKFAPTHLCDILQWDYAAAYPPGHFDVVWASPDCTQYSCARTKGPPRDLVGADRLVAKALEIIGHFAPRWWWVENPATGLLNSRAVIQALGAPYLVSYCHYGFSYRKHTNLWSNCPHFKGRACRRDCPHWDTVKKCHPASAQRGPNHYEDRKQLAYGMRGFSVTDLYRMPPALCDAIAAASAHL